MQFPPGAGVSREQSSPRAVLLMERAFSHFRLAVMRHFLGLLFEAYGNCTAWTSETAAHQPHRQGDSRAQIKSRFLRWASFVCSWLLHL